MNIQIEKQRDGMYHAIPTDLPGSFPIGISTTTHHAVAKMFALLILDDADIGTRWMELVKSNLMNTRHIETNLVTLENEKD